MALEGGAAADTPVAATPSVPEMLQAIMARFVQQEETNKATNERLAALAAAFGTLDGEGNEAETARRRLFATTNPNPNPNPDEPTDDALPTHVDTTHPTDGSDSLTSRQIADLQLSLRDIHSKIHHVKTSAPEIERVLASTQRKPFHQANNKRQNQEGGKASHPPVHRCHRSTDHMTAFNIAMGRNHFSDEERDAGLCQLFVESLSGPALSWFSHLKEHSIDSFHDLSASFLKNYIMWTRQGTSMADLWKLSQSSTDSLKDFMEKFKEVLSKVPVPDQTAVEALTNSLWINSKFRDYLYEHPDITIEDALHNSKNFIRLEEDKRAFNAKQQALKQAAAKATDAHEPRQHAPYNKNDRRKGIISAVGESEQSGTTAAVREPGWNVWERDTENKTQQPRSSSSGNPKSSSVRDLSKYCEYHEMKGHDTKECRHLYEAWLASTSDSRAKADLSKQKTAKNNKSWSKSKDKKKKSQGKEDRGFFPER
ncbi:uncharacterized protein LOC130506660 [Raphanus sativus]|uniref:Uncharacterized protein LOC130506660 n=1 Tax=Raphanus sativus TaxID=3726 RepID=A0A9W3D0H8_RAPSA|nr:uncharacterized protein LOC130506660 [Raphanus sativus]